MVPAGPEDFGGVFWLLSELGGIQGAAIVPADHPGRRDRPSLCQSGQKLSNQTKQKRTCILSDSRV